MSGRADDGGFLSRWSRRKREVAEEEAASVLAPPPGSEASPAAPVEEPGPAEPAPEMVEPPSLDLVDKDFDIAHWLKQNVPESWKLAALRRAWLADPAIRDYQNPARDYALDWNTPGGAPGYGPLSESDDVEAMIRDIFGETPEKPATEATEVAGDSMPHLAVPAGEDAESHVAEQQKALPGGEDALPQPEQNHENSPDRGGKAAKSSEPALAALQNQAKEAGPPLRIRKRGGGAMPI
ncbi:DUF3306 domain-containing protein [Bosea sp. (in: a-proteobacteria)]|jgi:hypothetical protein|uniref:DUF3306 domain-containing protein n=1 Tax=Bosea sp. (in: a-proteobacteria) TaxID=1871050 RepID=UPI003F6EE167